MEADICSDAGASDAVAGSAHPAPSDAEIRNVPISAPGNLDYLYFMFYII
jgi:hypothetical protein